MVRAAEPTDFQWFGVIVVMAMGLYISTHLARLANYLALPYRPLEFMSRIQAYFPLVIAHVVPVLSVAVGAQASFAIFGLTHFVSKVSRFCSRRLSHACFTECRIATLLTRRHIELINRTHLLASETPSCRFAVVLESLVSKFLLLVLSRPRTAPRTPLHRKVWLRIRPEMIERKTMLASCADTLLHNYNYTYNRASSQAAGGG